MVTEPGLPRQFEAIRDQDEHIYWAGKPAFVPFIVRGIPFLVFGLLWGAIDYFGFIRNMPSEMSGFAIPFFAIHLFPCYAAILNMVRLFLVHGNTSYACSNKRLMMRSGFWGTDFKTIDYDKISDMAVTVNPIEHFYGVGTLQAFAGRTTSKGGHIYDRFIAVKNPYRVFKKIKEISLAAKTDWNYPNALRPETNPGYRTEDHAQGRERDW